MDEILTGILSQVPAWSYQVIALLLPLTITTGMILILWKFHTGVRWYADTVARENRLPKVMAELQAAREEAAREKSVAWKLLATISNARACLDCLHHLEQENAELPEAMVKVAGLIQRVVEACATDVKRRPGELHRCGLWFESQGYLFLQFGSSGFSPEYLPNHGSEGRRLKVEQSIAGNCFRRQTAIKVDDVEEDPDFVKNEGSTSDYSAMLCVPVTIGFTPYGVLTVDGLCPLQQEDLQISRLYATIIEGALAYLIDIWGENDVSTEKAFPGLSLSKRQQKKIEERAQAARKAGCELARHLAMG
ncbi:MAG: GAF domain-containing protein [Firmicutes bacterium]|nr:GAF domain-containing protein [Bacillota bacterium]